VFIYFVRANVVKPYVSVRFDEMLNVVDEDFEDCAEKFQRLISEMRSNH
jgi:predicted transcriptional regulator